MADIGPVLPFLLVALGGAIGAVLRFASSTALARITGSELPWGTFFVNVAGSFAMGVLMVAVARLQLSDDVRNFAAVGVLGGFTTFSAFSWELVTMTRDGDWLRAATYAVASVVVAALALIAGLCCTSALLANSNG